MFNTKFMGIAVLFVALAVTANAFAYRSAVVTNALTLTVDSTTAAALAFDSAGVGTQDSGITVDTALSLGKMTLQVDTTTHKLQPDSVYTFQPAFKITNKTADDITLSATTTSSDPTVTVTLLASDCSGAFNGLVLQESTNVADNYSPCLRIAVAAGTTLVAKTGTIVVTGSRP
ncbi:MAG: hypothetical protein HY329_21885 [Chloroflexi bacterium]|nr:hypothetical protein [Chloroflexota bacterium]